MKLSKLSMVISRNHLIILTILLFAWGCASMQPPGGGPEDKEAPEVIWTIPANDSVRVSRKVDIFVAFSEKMNHETVENAVYLSPHPAGEIKFSWKKNVMKIELEDSLESNKTFVVTLGTDGKDIHANALQQAHSFAFSTGDSIDRGSINGRVIAENTKGISIWSYRLSGQANEDSLVCIKRADYITQVGAGGKYKLSYLSPGKYRVYAVADLDADYLYTPSSDYIGLTFKDVTVEPAKLEATGSDFMIFQEDTAKFTLQTVVPVDRSLVVVGFSKSLMTELYFENGSRFEGLKNHFRMTDSVSGTEIPIRDMYLNPVKLNEIKILTVPRNIQRRHVLSVRNLFSQSGEEIVSGDMSFEGGDDSSNIKIDSEMFSPQTKDGIVMANDVFGFRFSNGVHRASFEKYFRMRDSSGNQVNGLFKWAHSAQVEFQPAVLLQSRMAYTIDIIADSVKDWSGKVLGDTVIKYFVTTFKTDSLGFVSGIVADDDSVKAGAYYITCRNLNRGMRDYTVRIDKTGVFNLNYLVPGRYSVVAFRDEDGNGIYSYGRVSPIIFSERFTSYADTVVIRPNWETSNILLRFKD
ncbi:Ig-like domain-containing protein [bacterium]|nr:Ig-like domain-containing protein [bacterium]